MGLSKGQIFSISLLAERWLLSRCRIKPWAAYMKSTKANPGAPCRAIRLPEVCRLTGASRATVWRRIHDDPAFPKPFKLSAGITVWDEADVFNWLDVKKKASAPADAAA